MTKTELRTHPEYKLCMDKIKGYRPGFEFTLRYCDIPKAKANALMIVMRDACEQGLLESVTIGAGFMADGTFNPFMSETFRRTEVDHNAN